LLPGAAADPPRRLDDDVWLDGLHTSRVSLLLDGQRQSARDPQWAYPILYFHEGGLDLAPRRQTNDEGAVAKLQGEIDALEKARAVLSAHAETPADLLEELTAHLNRRRADLAQVE
jgi:hypothetical protein